jgi:hypothetical protein
MDLPKFLHENETPADIGHWVRLAILISIN